MSGCSTPAQPLAAGVIPISLVVAMWKAGLLRIAEYIE